MVDIGTPHIAGYSLDGKIAGMIMIYESACEHFAIEPKFGIEDFLPEPAVRELRIIPNLYSEEQTLLSAVRKIYRIGRDDMKLRLILEKLAGKRGEFFDSLRKNYPVRREFQNTRVVLDVPSKATADKLAGIGFKI
jgi:erythronate-4-phosphate dehydrogenase